MVSSKKNQPGTAVKKNSLLAGFRGNDKTPHGQGSKPVANSTGQQNYQVSSHDHGHVSLEETPCDRGVAIARSNQRNCNPERIAQWAANSATNSNAATGPGFTGYDSASYRNDMLVTNVAQEIPGAFPFSHPDVVQAPSQFLSMYQFYGVEETYPNTGTVTTGSQYPGINVAFEMAQSQAFDSMQAIQGEHYTNSSSMNNMPYQSMTTGGLFPGLAELHPPMVLGNNDGGYVFPEWDSQVLYQDNAVVSQPLEYSPASGLAPSMSSSFSQRSCLGQLPDTPVSMDLHEDWPISEPGPMNESIPHFRVGGAMQIQPPFDLSADSERFAFQNNDNCLFFSDFPLSTIRSGNSFQRTPLSMDAWVGPPEMIDPAYGFPSYTGMDGSRRSSDGEAGRNAREDPRYKAVPQEDGLYHCPFSIDGGCHKSPEKLKCNYE